MTLVLFAAFFWGTTFVLVKETISLIPVNFFLFIRFGFATLLTLPLVIKRNKWRNRSLWQHGTLLGLLLFASYYFQTIGLLFTTPANAAFITGLNIIFIPLLGAILFKFNIRPMERVAVVVSFTGTVLLTLNFDNFTLNIGDMIIILTAISIAFHVLFTEKYRDHDFIEFLWIQFLVMTICAGLLAVFSAKPTIAWYSSKIVLFTLVVTVIFSTIYAFGAQLYAQQLEISSSIIGVLFSMEPVFALIIDISLGIIPTFTAMIGMGCIFVSILMATLVSTQDRSMDEPSESTSLVSPDLDRTIK